MTIEEQLKTAERERDSFKRRLATLQDAILLALVQRIEPRMSRHPVTVVQHAGSIIARIGEAMACQFEDGDDLVEATKELVRERDEARAEVERLRIALLEVQTSESAAAWFADGFHDGWKIGAEAMREACAREASICANHRGDELADILSAMPIPEES